MKRTLLVLLAIVGLGTQLFAAEQQATLSSRLTKKLEKYYADGKTDKGLELCKDLQKNYRKCADLQFIHSLFLSQKSDKAKSATFRKKYLAQSATYFKKGVKLDSNASYITNNSAHKTTTLNHFRAYVDELSSRDSSRVVLMREWSTAYLGVGDTVFQVYFTKINSLRPVVEPSPVATNTVDNDLMEVTKDGVRVSRLQLMSYASSLVGTPYKWAGESKEGLDCSGFNLFVYKNSGVKLPHNAHMQSKLGKKVALEDSKPGDLIFFGYETEKGYRASHTGMIYKNDEDGLAVIHCVSRGVVIDSDFFENYWAEKVLFVKRIIQ